MLIAPAVNLEPLHDFESVGDQFIVEATKANPSTLEDPIPVSAQDGSKREVRVCISKGIRLIGCFQLSFVHLVSLNGYFSSIVRPPSFVSQVHEGFHILNVVPLEVLFT